MGDHAVIAVANGIQRRKKRSLAERFWARVDTSAGEDGCWLWLGSTLRGRYGQIRRDPEGSELRGKKATTHRVAWELTRGPIPAGIHVCHLCDNPRCVSPKHLWLGTHAENLADMKAKGRAARGDRSGTARLKPAQVHAIRKLLAAGRCGVADLAGLTNVSVGTIEDIKYRKSWRHLDA